MTTSNPSQQHTQSNHWLKSYYATRAAFSVAWVAAAFTIGRDSPMAASVLLAVYPLWDALANLVDAQKNGGYRNNPTQTFNTVVSIITAIAVLAALQVSMHAVLGVFGVWASLSGLLQLATAIRRRKSNGAQWAMILSGAQSTLAGASFIYKAVSPTAMPSVTDIAPYAAFGAFYFLVSAAHLAITGYRARK